MIWKRWHTNKVIYLTSKEILLIHSLVIDETGGSHGLRDHQAVLGLENLPKQRAFRKDLYPTIFLKAAVYARNIIMGHPFIDGNKRTGLTAASAFIENNGYMVVARRGEIEKFALKVVRQKLSLETISDWFYKHARRVK